MEKIAAMSASSKEKLMDSLGWKLLIELQKDGRISFAELGRRVGLSTPAVAQRVGRMEDEGIIRAYRADVSPRDVGLPITAFIRMSVVGDVLAKLTARVRTMPEIVECHHVTGEDSFQLKLVASSIGHLEELVGKLSAFGQTTTSIVLSTTLTRNLAGLKPAGMLG